MLSLGRRQEPTGNHSRADIQCYWNALIRGFFKQVQQLIYSNLRSKLISPCICYSPTKLVPKEMSSCVCRQATPRLKDGLEYCIRVEQGDRFLLHFESVIITRIHLHSGFFLLKLLMRETPAWAILLLLNHDVKKSLQMKIIIIIIHRHLKSMFPPMIK